MRTIVILSLLWAFCLPPAAAQFYPNPQSKDTAHYPYWASMMQDPDASFHAIQSAFEKYWAGPTDYSHNGWKIFKRWEYIQQFRVGRDGKLPKPGAVLKEYYHYMDSDNSMSPNGNWTELGPVVLPSNSTSQPNGMGRVNGVAFHPTDANTMYVGAPSGGLWKTTNAGTTWTVLTSSIPTLGVSSILIHPTTPDLILIGTGDRDATAAPGMGVYRSTDGGASWAASNTGIENATVGMMIMHPSNSNIILAATSKGIFKSIDGGLTWVNKSGDSYNYKDIRFKPGTPSIVYATTQGSFYRSDDSGETWTNITSGVISGSRIVIGVSPNKPAYVYLLQTNGPFAGLLLSTDSGLNFSTQSTSPNLMGYACDGIDTKTQAWYDLCIAVDPNNANIIYTGGINMWKSTDGGVSWTINSHWIGTYWNPSSCAPSVHADIHSLDWSPLNGKLYSGGDGGLYVTSNGGTVWNDLSSGLAIAQIYKIGQSATKQGLTINGYQDNGTSTNINTSFTTVIGGDGMECIIDYSDTNYRYGALYYGDIRRSTGGSYSSIGGEGVNGITESGAWVTPYILHKTTPSTMFAGYKNVWRSVNVKAGSVYSVSWDKISSGETKNCTVLEQSAANLDILYVSRGDEVKRSDNANDASPTWTTITTPGESSVTDIKAHPANQNIVYASAGNKVYKSINKGMTWTDISGTLPAIPVNCIVYDKNSSEGLYIGNQTSVFYKDSSMTNWILFSTGLPTVDVRELEIYYDPVNPANNRLKAATYGRGLWQSALYSTAASLAVAPSVRTATALAGITTFTVTSTTSWTAQSNVVWCSVTPSGTGNGTLTATYSSDITSASRTATITVTAAGTAPVTVTVYQSGLAPPPYLQSSVLSNTVQLNWGMPGGGNGPAGQNSSTASPGIVGYNIYRNGDIIYTNPSVDSLTFFDKNLPNDNYAYKVTVKYDLTSYGFPGQYGESTYAGPVQATINVLLPSNLNIQNITLASGQTKCYNALQTIIIAGNGTIFTVPNNASATLIAGQNIRLLPGSSVQSGGYFWAYITSTSSFCPPPSVPSANMSSDSSEILNVFEDKSGFFRIYPNPANGKIFLELTGENSDMDAVIRIYNMMGNEVLYKYIHGTPLTELSLESLSPGIYLTKVMQNGKMETVKIIRQ